jgi:hypothetical protein
MGPFPGGLPTMPGAAPSINVLRSPALPPPAFGGFQPPGQESSTYEAVTAPSGQPSGSCPCHVRSLVLVVCLFLVLVKSPAVNNPWIPS